MNRFTVSILLATGLLGVLVWIVLSMARDLARAPDEPLPLPVEAQVETFDPALPRLTSFKDLQLWLTSQGLAASLPGDSRRWLQERGFPTANLPLLPPLDQDPAYQPPQDFSELDDAALVDYAGAGIAGAMQELAERSIGTDPLAALEWYDQAIVSGSLYAMVRTADLLTTLGDPAIDQLAADPVWREALNQIRNTSPVPRERALAWSIALITLSGYAVMSNEHADRISSLAALLDDAGIERACEAAQDYVLAAAGSRRALGEQLFSMVPPPFALTVADPAEVIPCDVPVPPLVTLEQCAAADFVGPGPQLMTAWVCPP